MADQDAVAPMPTKDSQSDSDVDDLADVFGRMDMGPKKCQLCQATYVSTEGWFHVDADDGSLTAMAGSPMPIGRAVRARHNAGHVSISHPGPGREIRPKYG